MRIPVELKVPFNVSHPLHAQWSIAVELPDDSKESCKLLLFIFVSKVDVFEIMSLLEKTVYKHTEDVQTYDQHKNADYCLHLCLGMHVTKSNCRQSGESKVDGNRDSVLLFKAI